MKITAIDCLVYVSGIYLTMNGILEDNKKALAIAASAALFSVLYAIISTGIRIAKTIKNEK